MDDDLTRLLDDQVSYYRARAGEYDRTSMPEGDPFAVHGARLRAAVAEMGLRGRVLEIAAGTGQWSGLLADTADELVVTDASPEMLELNRTKLGLRPNVVHRRVDAFALDLGQVDAAFLGFFLSHVPGGAFARFWGGLGRVVRPGGQVAFVDEGWPGARGEEWIDSEHGVVRRMLADGSVHRAVKVLWRSDDLVARLAEIGWDASVQSDGPFYSGSARIRGN